MKTLQEIIARLAAIDEEVRTAKTAADVDKLAAEKKELLERKGELEQLEQRRQTALDITAGNIPGTLIDSRGGLPAQAPACVGAESKEYRSAFLKNLLGREMNDVEKREFAFTNGAGNATAVVPIVLSNSIFDMMVKIAPMINEITLMRIAGSVRIAVEGTNNAAAVHVENAAVVPAADTMVFITLGGFEFMKVQRISATVRSMGIDAFEAWLVKMLAEGIALQLEGQIILGTSVTGGIETSNVWANGVNGIDYGAAVTYDNLVDLIALLPARYDRNAKWLMSKAMFYNQIAKITDANGTPILVRDPVNAAAMRILGFPVLISDSVGAGNAYLGDYTAIMGNLSQDVTIESSTQSGFLNNSIDFRGTCIFDCDLADNAAMRKLFT